MASSNSVVSKLLRSISKFCTSKWEARVWSSLLCSLWTCIRDYVNERAATYERKIRIVLFTFLSNARYEPSQNRLSGAVFGPLDKSTRSWYVQELAKAGGEVTQRKFPLHFRRVLRRQPQTEKLKRCGLCPFEVEAVDYFRIMQFPLIQPDAIQASEKNFHSFHNLQKI